MAIDDNTSYELTGYQVKDLASKVRGKADSSSLASVATSGLYSDLTGKPTIPTVNNGTLTIKQNGTTIDTFTANQSMNVTVDLAGGIYADDPTAPANPDGWVNTSELVDEAVTAAKIDFDTLSTGAPSSLGLSTSGGTFTATSFGMACVQTAVAAGANVVIKKNDVQIAKTQAPTSGAYTWVPVTVILGKSDVLKVETSDSGGNAQVVTSGSVFYTIG